MLRVPFTAEDLLQVRFADRPAPMLELAMAIATYQRDDAVFARWTRQTRLPREARALLELIPPSATGPLFLEPIGEDLEECLDTVLSTPASVARSELIGKTRPTPLTKSLADRDHEAWRTLEDALRGAYGAIITPNRRRIGASFAADLAWRRVNLAERGVGATLAGIYPGSRWTGSTLEIDVPGDSEWGPAGHGLTLMPSVFWTGRPLVGEYTDGSRLLLYPALTPLPLIDAEAGNALSALLGRTRAAILELLVENRTTTEIAARMRISAASASAHAKTLRGAGLVTTRRTGKAVSHVATPLGLRLLRRG